MRERTKQPPPVDFHEETRTEWSGRHKCGRSRASSVDRTTLLSWQFVPKLSQQQQFTHEVHRFSEKLERNVAASAAVKRATLPWRASRGRDTDFSIDQWIRSGEEEIP